MVITKMRNNFVKQAFIQYRDYVQYLVQADKNDGKAEEVIWQWHLKKKRQFYNAWCAYNHETKRQFRALRVFMKWMISN